MRNGADKLIGELGLDRDRFFQRNVLELVKNPFRDVWTTVYSTQGKMDGAPSIFCCLAEMEMRKSILDGADWPVHAESFSPGFEMSGDNVRYVSCAYPGYTYLVAKMYFHPFERCQMVINNEFILLFNLWLGDDGNYYEIGESGERLLVISVGDEVKFRTSFLKRFIAAKQALFVQLIDSRVSSSENYPSDADFLCSDGRRGENFNYSIWFSSTPSEGYLLSMLYARSLVDPSPQDFCGIWPYESKDDYYPEFLIEEKPDGSEIRFTCNPDKLSNYFGQNIGAPHYLTPVYFKAL